MAIYDQLERDELYLKGLNKKFLWIINACFHLSLDHKHAEKKKTDFIREYLNFEYKEALTKKRTKHTVFTKPQLYKKFQWKFWSLAIIYADSVHKLNKIVC